MAAVSYSLPFSLVASRTRVLRSWSLPFLGVVALQSALLLLLNRGDVYGVLHGILPWIILLVAAFIVAMLLSTWQPQTLRTTAEGIDLSIGKARYFYAWRDIAEAEQVQYGVKLTVRGRSDIRNKYNVIPVQRLGIPAAELAKLIEEGIAQFSRIAEQPLAGSLQRKSFTQGDNAEAIQAHSNRGILALFGTMLLLGVGAIITPAGLDAWRTLSLRHDGQRSEASVVRFYVSGCGRRSCSTDVEYAFEAHANGHQHEFHGNAYIADSTHQNTDADYLSAKAFRKVPVVYNRSDPTISALNFRDDVYRGNPLSRAAFLMGLEGGIVAAVVGLMAGGFWMSVRSQRRKLAADAAAPPICSDAK